VIVAAPPPTKLFGPTVAHTVSARNPLPLPFLHPEQGVQTHPTELAFVVFLFFSNVSKCSR
jgi:hypothetical protein